MCPNRSFLGLPSEREDIPAIDIDLADRLLSEFIGGRGNFREINKQWGTMANGDARSILPSDWRVPKAPTPSARKYFLAAPAQEQRFGVRRAGEDQAGPLLGELAPALDEGLPHVAAAGAGHAMRERGLDRLAICGMALGHNRSEAAAEAVRDMHVFV